MNSKKSYRVPDILDKIYNDVVLGLYTPDPGKVKADRIVIAKCNIACDILIKSDNTELDICNELDFPSLKDFRNIFKGFLGIYPSEFRNRFATD